MLGGTYLVFRRPQFHMHCAMSITPTPYTYKATVNQSRMDSNETPESMVTGMGSSF